LLTSLPTGNSTVRMRVWRALKSTGCGVLRDGVYVLPVESSQAAALAAAEVMVRDAGGFAMTVELNVKTPAQIDHLRSLFDRGPEYGVIVTRIGAAKAALQRMGKRKGSTLVQRLREAVAQLVAIDFYPGEARRQAEAAMASLEDEAQRLFVGGEPHAASGRVRRLDPRKFRGRTWATRKDLWVDRLASVWLIRRFIDKDANFAWIDRPRDRPREAVGFDFDGAQFTHVEDRVTFEVLMASFGLDSDHALAALGEAIHFLDVGGIPVADARGMETMLRGIKARSQGDDETAREAGKVFDVFYSAYAQQKAA
jgi:hypothetical protein